MSDTVIHVNNGAIRIETQTGQPLLSALSGYGISVPSACNGRGACGLCRVKVLAGGGDVSQREQRRLTEQDLAAGLRLSCQVVVNGEMRVEIPESVSGRRYRGKIIARRPLTPTIQELTIGLGGEAFEFQAGQCIQLHCPPYDGMERGVSRAYTISSMPSRKDAIELMIRHVPGGICSTWACTMLCEGDEVEFTGPHGDFHIHDGDAEMVWIAGGSGMAPFWSMIRDLAEKGNRRKVTFCFGAVYRRELFLLEEFQRYQNELPWFRFVPALSGPAESDTWAGQRGLVTEVLFRDGSIAPQEAYLCGSPGMIAASINVLRQKGVAEKRMYYDEFA
jgi:Na+-transporting NADH:ubiquinone oxidoreductase subunit F